jgi:hypothetical protein
MLDPYLQLQLGRVNPMQEILYYVSFVQDCRTQTGALLAQIVVLVLSAFETRTRLRSEEARAVLPAKLGGFRPPWFRPPGETPDAADEVSPKRRNSKTAFFSA